MGVHVLAIVILAICQLTSLTPLESTEAPETTVSTAAPNPTSTAPNTTTTATPNTTTAAASNVTSTTAPAITNCTTAKGVKGECTQRQGCDYSTAAIDLTLFATHSYVSPCAAGETCCPFDALVRMKDTGSPSNDDSTFDFDEDD